MAPFEAHQGSTLFAPSCVVRSASEGGERDDAPCQQCELGALATIARDRAIVAKFQHCVTAFHQFYYAQCYRIFHTVIRHFSRRLIVPYAPCKRDVFNQKNKQEKKGKSLYLRSIHTFISSVEILQTLPYLSMRWFLSRIHLIQTKRFATPV